MNLLSKITLLFACVLAMGNLYAQPIKIIDPNNQNQILVLSTLWCKTSGATRMYQYGNEVSRDSNYAPSKKCYQMDDDKKFILLDEEKIPYKKIKVLDIKSGKGLATADFNTEQGRKRIAAEQNKEIDRLREANGTAYPNSNTQITNNQSQPQPVSSGRVIGQSFDSQANGNIFLYDGACQLPNYASSYPLHWDAKKVDDGTFIGDGCYSYNQQTQQVFIVASTGKTASLPMSSFQNGGDSNKSAFQSFSEGLQRAATYWNNSANDTQRNTTNLTPSFSGGNRGMNCTPDGRGGYNCR